MALDSATTDLVDRLRATGAPPLEEQDVAAARAQGRALTTLLGPGPAVHRRGDVMDGPTPMRILVPHDRPRAVIVYFHGGGWTIGGIDEVEPLCRHLAVRTGSTVVMVGYRLAPEHRFPAAVDDCWAATRWLSDRRPRLGCRDVAPMIVAGDSAGGNLAAVVARRARDRGRPAIALQVLAYPVTDSNLSTASYLAAENQVVITRGTMRWFWDHYVPDPSRRDDPDAAPLRAPDLRDVAPGVVLIGEHDPLRDEGEAFAHRLQTAEVPVSLHILPGQMHGFLPLIDLLPGARAGLEIIVTEIDTLLAKTP